MKDVTGQIDAVVDVETNTIIYSCTYDAWGYILDEYCTDALVAYGNPLRYKDYNYDVDSDLYYLQSRFYDAEMSRFINADDPTLTDTNTGTLISSNMYAYCENNPIMLSDWSGRISTILVGLVIDVAISVMNPGVAATYDTLGNLLKAYYRSKGKTYAVNYIKNKIVPVFTHSFMNNFLTAIRRAIQKICGATLNNLGSSAMGKVFSCLKNIICGKNYSGITIFDVISMLFSIGSFVSGVLDWISDGKMNGKVKIPFNKGWLNYIS